MSPNEKITVPCGSCGGPTAAVVPPPELARFASLLKPVCAACVVAGEREEAERSAREQAERREQARRHRLARVGVPRYLRGYGFGDIDRPAGLERALQLARAWASGEARGVGLVGPMGVGKSRVSVAAANEACAHRRVRWYSTPVLIAQLGSGAFDSPARQAALAALTGSGALVLDDVDKARPTEYAAEQLFMAVDARCDGGGPLFVTTNLRGRELAERWPQPYGEALASRLSLLSWTRVEGADKRTMSGGAR